MDGSGSTFLRDSTLRDSTNFSGVADRMAGGIMYFEEFDLDSPVSSSNQDKRSEPPRPPELTEQDVQAARQAGHEEGMRLALAEGCLVQAELHAAAVQSLADALAASHAMLQRTVKQTAEGGVRTILALLQAALPATMVKQALCEVDAVLRALLPGLACEPELRVRVHPKLADHVRETLVGLLASDGPVLSVVADPQLSQGDVHIAWRDGGARRESGPIWTEIRTALAPLGLPSLEEICCGH